MYVPSHFAAGDGEALIRKLARRFAGILVTVDGDGQPVATHIPLLWNAEMRTLTGHIARANPHWRQGGGRGLVVLAGAEAYVSPGYYPSKREHGKTVPTWNYEAVHLSGPVEWFEDAVRLEGVVRALSQAHEQGRAEPWALEDAPRPYIEALLRGIVGVEMRVEAIDAKRKLSQNKSVADFDGVIAGLDATQDAASHEIAMLMRATRAVADDPDGN